MHSLHPIELVFVISWIIASVLNWFFMAGFNNQHFREHLTYNESWYWVISAAIFTGFGGLITSIFAGHCSHMSYRPLTSSQKEQVIMLRKFEGSETEGRI